MTGLARRLGDPRRQSRVAGGQTFPWTGLESYLWFAFDAALSLVEETGVATWPDQSDNANDITQADTGKQPLLTTFNGRSAVHFQGTDDFLANTAGVTGHSAGQQITLFCATKYDAAGGGDNGAIWDCNSQAIRWFQENGTFNNRAGFAQEDIDFSFSDESAAHIFEFRAGPSDGEAWLDGASQGTYSLSKTLPQATQMWVGSLNGAYYSQQKMHSLLGFVDLPAADQAVVRSRLGGRWGISVS